MGINEIILDVAKEFFELQIDQPFTQSEIEDILYEFGHKMCELQKVECANNAEIDIIDMEEVKLSHCEDVIRLPIYGVESIADYEFLNSDWKQFYSFDKSKEYVKSLKPKFKVGDIVVTNHEFLFKITEIIGLNLYHREYSELRYLDNDGTCRLANNDEIIYYYENQGWVKGAKFRHREKEYIIESIYVNPVKEITINTTDKNIAIILSSNCELIKEPELPKKWEDLEEITGHYLFNGKVKELSNYFHRENIKQFFQKDTFATEKQAKSTLAFAQLSQLVKKINGDWIPDWSNVEETKYIVRRFKNKLDISWYSITYKHLCFPTRDLAEYSLTHHIDLWEQYYEL